MVANFSDQVLPIFPEDARLRSNVLVCLLSCLFLSQSDHSTEFRRGTAGNLNDKLHSAIHAVFRHLCTSKSQVSCSSLSQSFFPVTRTVSSSALASSSSEWSLPWCLSGNPGARVCSTLVVSFSSRGSFPTSLLCTSQRLAQMLDSISSIRGISKMQLLWRPPLPPCVLESPVFSTCYSAFRAAPMVIGTPIFKTAGQVFKRLGGFVDVSLLLGRC